VFERRSLTYLLYFTIDIGLTLLALRLARGLREIIPIGVYLDEPLQFSAWLYVIVPVIWLAVFATLRLYNPTRSLRHNEDLPAVWGAIFGASLIFAGTAYLLFRELSRFLFFYFLLLDLLLLSGWRWGVARWPRLSRRLYGPRRRVLIVGAGPVGRELARALLSHATLNLELVGFAAAESPAGSRDTLPAAILGPIEALAGLAQSHRVDEIIFTLPLAQQPLLREAVVAVQSLPVNVRMVPDVFDLVFVQASVEEFAGIPLIGLREPAIQGLDRLNKRLFDLIVSSLLLVILSPLIGMIALLIKVDSAGPVLFRQQRVGEGGRLFWMNKFRSMVAGAEQEEVHLLRENGEGLTVFSKTVNDARITRIGRFLRRTSLDELPQLINVLKGEMSLVGPRPELPGVVEAYQLWQHKRFAVPQGMTGWWQVNGRMTRADPRLRAEDDLFYIRNYSLWLDLRILLKTIQAVFIGEGAY
jgi:exopolysaccharide biosynthesis polyprenyl glycosylphosphotransferase